MIYTGSAMLTAIPSQELEDFITAKFYYTYTFADSI